MTQKGWQSESKRHQIALYGAFTTKLIDSRAKKLENEIKKRILLEINKNYNSKKLNMEIKDFIHSINLSIYVVIKQYLFPDKTIRKLYSLNYFDPSKYDNEKYFENINDKFPKYRLAEIATRYYIYLKLLNKYFPPYIMNFNFKNTRDMDIPHLPYDIGKYYKINKKTNTIVLYDVFTYFRHYLNPVYQTELNFNIYFVILFYYIFKSIYPDKNREQILKMIGKTMKSIEDINTEHNKKHEFYDEAIIDNITKGKDRIKMHLYIPDNRIEIEFKNPEAIDRFKKIIREDYEGLSPSNMLVNSQKILLKRIKKYGIEKTMREITEVFELIEKSNKIKNNNDKIIYVNGLISKINQCQNTYRFKLLSKNEFEKLSKTEKDNLYYIPLNRLHKVVVIE